MSLGIAVHGAGGKMGQRLCALIAADDGLRLTCALDAPNSPLLGRPAAPDADVRLTSDLAGNFDVMIDFSVARAAQRAVDLCLAARRPIVIGTTGFSPPQQAAIDAAAEKIAVLQSPNFSVGVQVLLRLVRDAAAALGDAYDIEIVETHHRFKADAPSGTALAIKSAIESVRPATKTLHGRHGQVGPRGPGEIAVHAVRLGDTIGEHAVHFGCLGETISIAHQSHSRDIYAHGALRAARWLHGKPAGRYAMADVLFEKPATRM